MRQQSRTVLNQQSTIGRDPRRQFIVQPILDPASHDLADSTHYDKDKATPTPPIIAMLPLEEEQDTNTNQEQANGVECCYFVAGDKPDQLLHDGSPLIGQFSHVRFPNDTSRLKAQLSGRMNEPVTLCFDGGQGCFCISALPKNMKSAFSHESHILLLRPLRL